MSIRETLQATRCRALASCGSKKSSIELAANIIAEDFPALNADYIFTQLLGRERIGSTGIGQGIGIPHCRVANCTSAISCLITLDNSVDFESIDNEPVDLLFTLVVPEEASDEHVIMLADIAKIFSVGGNLKRLRSSLSDQDLFDNAVELFNQ